MARLPATYEFGDVRVDATSELVSQSGSPVLLEPKAFELLIYFIQHRGKLLDKQEILDAVWGETFVSENALTRVVAQLRKALGDDAHQSKYIETVPRRGYRFVADVRTVVEAGPPPSRGKKVLVLAGAAVGVVVLVVAALMLNAPGDEVVSWSDQPVQLTSSAALDISLSISPDGDAFAFSSNRDGNFEIYVKQLTPAGEVIQLTSDGSQNFEPAWSPEGNLIAYNSKNRGGIWVAPAFGGSPRKLTDFGGRPAWSPDGRQIAFQSSPLADLGADAATIAPSTLWICDVEGGSPRQLTKAGEPLGGHASPTWSPQGDRIAFVSGSNLWTVSLEGELQKVFEGPRGYLRDVVYAPSGNELYYTGHGELWALDPTRKDAEPRSIRKSVSSAIRYPSFSADGKKLAYSEVATLSNLALVPLSPDTYEAVGPPRPLTEYTNHRNLFPRFSPDGRTIAFQRDIAGTGSDIWILDVESGNVRRLTAQRSSEFRPSWSPDGERVLFSAEREGYGLGFWSVDVATGEEALLRARPAHWYLTDLSRDTRRIAFTSNKNGGVYNIWVAGMDENEEERQLTFEDEFVGWPSWAPDGERIAIQIKRDADEHVGLVPAEGGTPVQLTTGPGHNWSGAWSPDGDKIAFASLRGDAWNLRWVDRTDKSECQITDYTALNSFVRYPAWSPLGDQIVYEYAETTGDIWMLERP